MDKDERVNKVRLKKLKDNNMKDMAIQEIANILPDLIETGIGIWKLDAQKKAYWEKTKADIARISKESEVRLIELQHELSKAKERTERLRILTETINRNPNLPTILQEGISKALENITKEI